jgi:hypothetical protein
MPPINNIEVQVVSPLPVTEVQVQRTGPQGPAGADGPAGPNSVTSATTSDGTAELAVFSMATEELQATDATIDALVIESGGLTMGAGTTISINATTFTYGTGAASAHRTALGLGATGSIAASDPLTVTQTWTDAAVTYTGLQVNITDTASAAASLLMDLRVSGVRRLSVRKDGRVFFGDNGFDAIWTVGGRLEFTAGGAGPYLGVQASNVIIQNSSRLSFSSSASPGDTILVRDAANTLAQRNGTAAQESRIYGTYTDTSNYRRLALKMSTAGVAQIVAEGAGTGAVGNLLELPANTTFADLTATRAALGIQTKTGTSTGLDAVGTTDITGLTGYALEADTWYKLELQYLWTSSSSNFQINFVTTGTLLRGGTTPVLGQSMSSAASLNTTFFVNDTTFALRGSVGENRTNLPAFGYAYFKTGTAGTGKVQLQLLAGTTLSTIVSSCAVLTKQQ